MNNEYHIDISFDFSDVDDLGRKLSTIVKDVYSRSLTGHFEEREVGLGWEIDINEGAEYDTSTSIMEKFAGIDLAADGLKKLMDEPYRPDLERIDPNWLK